MPWGSCWVPAGPGVLGKKGDSYILVSRVGIITLGACSCSPVAVWGVAMRESTLQLCLSVIPISQHLPREGPWREVPGGHSWGVQLCFHAPFTLCFPRADCDLRDLQDMQEEEGDTSDGLEVARNQPDKPVSACLSPGQVCSAPAWGGGSGQGGILPVPCWGSSSPCTAWLMLEVFVL